MPTLTVEHALGFVNRQQYEDEAILRVKPEELGITNKYNTRLQLRNTPESRFAADFLAQLGDGAIRQTKRIVSLGFISLDGKDTGIVYQYEMDESGLLIAQNREKVGYLLGAGRAIDGWLNSILDTADAEDSAGELEHERQLQLV